ncbi:MAG: hypothetical protein ACJAZ2_000901 [Glaciecola sp.]|jgi:hypothetical protein
MNWTSVTEQLPEDNQTVLAFVPYNRVPTPGDPTVTVFQPVKILVFNRDFYGKHRPKHKRSENNHFWSGLGLSNHFFQEVTHWMSLPLKP